MYNVYIFLAKITLLKKINKNTNYIPKIKISSLRNVQCTFLFSLFFFDSGGNEYNLGHFWQLKSKN